LNLRSDPGRERIGTLRHEEEVTILDRVSFYRRRTGSGQVGYVHGNYLQPQPEEGALVDVSLAENELQAVSARPAWTPTFEAVTYANPRFIDEPLKVDRDFLPRLEKLARFARECNLNVYVTPCSTTPNSATGWNR
jgi:hypothetical protein